MPDDTSGPHPSETDIRKELDAAKELWADTMVAKAKLQDMYRRTYSVQYLKSENTLIPPVEFRSGEYDENIDRVVGQLNVETRYTVAAKGIGPMPIKRAEKIEDWDNRIIPLIERAQGQSFSNDLCHEGVNYGLTALSILPDPSAWSRYPKYDSGDPKHYNKLVEEFGELAPPPIRITHIPLLTWRPLLSGRIVLKSFQTQTVRAADIRFRYSDLKLPDREKLKDTDELEYVTYIDDTWCIYLVMRGVAGSSNAISEIARPWRHHMNFDGQMKGRAPVVMYEGLTTGDTDLQHRWKGYAESIVDTIRVKDMIVSAQSTRSLLAGGLTMDGELDIAITPEQVKMLNAGMTYVPGGTNIGIPGFKWVEHKFGDVPIVQEYVFKKLESIIESRFPPTLRGQIDAGTPGFAINLAAEYAMAILKPVAQSFASSDVTTIETVHRTLGALEDMAGGPVTVYVHKKTKKETEAVGLKWDDVKDISGLLDAVREAKLPMDRQADLDAMDKGIRLKFPWTWAAQELARVENPQELMDQAEAEEFVRTDPELVELKRLNIRRRLADLRDKKEGITPEELAAMGPLPPALQQLLVAMQGGQVPPEGPVGPMEGGMVGPSVMPGGQAPVLPPGAPPPVMGATPPPPPASMVSAGPPPPRVNPRAGQRSQPGGPRRRTGSVQQGGRT